MEINIDDDLQEQIQNNLNSNNMTSNSIIRMIGDKMTLVQVIKLLAYIRHSIKNNKPCDILVHVGKNVQDGKFMFDVNQFEVKDLITKEEVEIN